MEKTLRNIVGGVLIGASVLFNPIKSHAEEIINGFVDKVYPIKMTSEYGEKTEEKLGIEIDLDQEEKILSFAYITENYDKENWSKEEEKIPLPARYTNINHNFTKVFVLHPKEVEISNIEQVAYIVPQHEREFLKPLEESPKAQLTLKTGELLMNWVIGEIGIPFANELFDKFIEYSIEKSEKQYNEIFKEINEDYTATQIPSFPVDRFGGFMETARGYIISFDMSEAPKGDVPMSLWAKIALGNPSQSSHGSFPNRYGELENIIINFSLEGEERDTEITPNDTYIEDLSNGIKLEMIKIPSTSPVMYMGKYEITQEQYQQIMGENPSHFKGPKNPVESLFLKDALEFCQRLSQLTGKRYTLPDPQGWFTAWSGGEKTKDYLNYLDKHLNEHSWNKQNSGGKTHPIGQKKPNPVGLYDIDGNVMEMVLPNGIKGTSFKSSEIEPNSYELYYNTERLADSYVGFRVMFKIYKENNP